MYTQVQGLMTSLFPYIRPSIGVIYARYFPYLGSWNGHGWDKQNLCENSFFYMGFAASQNGLFILRVGIKMFSDSVSL